MYRPSLFLVSILVATAGFAPAQDASSPITSPVVRDPRAVTLLNQSISAAAGSAGLASYQDFTATGTITYFSAGEDVGGSVTVRGRGPDQFRIDASLSMGTRSWVVSHGIGAIREVESTVSPLPYHNTVNIGVLTFPYPTIARAIYDPSYSISYLGPATFEGHTVIQIMTTRNFSSQDDPVGLMSGLCVTVYFIDAQTNLVLKIQDMTHPPNDLGINFKHEIEFGDYITSNGYQLPTLIREKVIDQPTWEIRLSSIAFNSGLTDLDFTLR